MYAAAHVMLWPLLLLLGYFLAAIAVPSATAAAIVWWRGM
jgi:hypothetical protein